MQSKFLFTVIKKNSFVADTIDKLLEALSWSVNVLLSGQTPHASWQGHPLAGGGVDLTPGGYRGALCQVRGDWELYTSIFYFRQWNQFEMCPFCGVSATIDAHAWSDFRDDAWWRDTIWNHEDYAAYVHATGRALPIMFRPGVGVLGLRLSNVMVDVLHTVDQGVASHIIANIIWYYAVVMAVFGGATYAERILRCQADLKRWYAETRETCRIQGPLTQERVRPSGDWPRLKAKAAATRHLAAYALDLAQRFAKADSPDLWVQAHDEMSIAVCQLLVEFYSIMKNESMNLSAAAKTRLPQLANSLAQIYSNLSRMCFDRGLRLWKLSPKLHLFLHLCMEQPPEMGNPSFWWCYGDEDLVKWMIQIAEGVHPLTLATSVLTKWLWCIFDQVLIDFDMQFE